MTIKLTLNNFQIHKDNEFTFKKGITAILGQGASGKTAIFRSLETLINNPSKNDDDIYHGNNNMRIQLEFLDINKNYVYSKSTSGVEYIINGLVFTKLNRANILKVDPNFPFVFDENDSILNIQGEWDIMFPFGRKDAQLFSLFEDIFEIIDSSVMIKEFNSLSLLLKKEVNEKNEQTQILAKKRAAIYNFISKTFNSDNLKALNKKLIDINSIKVLKDIDANFDNSLKPVEFDQYKLILSYKPIKNIDAELNPYDSDLLNLYNRYNYLNKFKSLPDIQLKKLEFNLDNINVLNRQLSDITNAITCTDKVNLFDTSKIDQLNKTLSELQATLTYKEYELVELKKICPTCNRPL